MRFLLTRLAIADTYPHRRSQSPDAGDWPDSTATTLLAVQLRPTPTSKNSMRNNQPVTSHEHLISDNATLMSTTDPNSYISYANAAFVEASGYSIDDLRSQPHNIVRHPDMPKEAFADMWATLKSGEPWSALVKNRRQNGDYYWVRANAVPIIRNGQTMGYMSVRTKASSDEIHAVSKLYAAMRAGQAKGVRLYKGVLIRTGLGKILSAGKLMGLRTRMRLNMLSLWLIACAGSLALVGTGTTGLSVVGLLTLLFLVGCGMLESQFARPIEQLRKQALDVATGNNRDAMPIDRVDEIGITMRTVSQLGLMFRWLIDDVSQQVLSVRSAVEEIAKGNLDLSERTERSASNVQQTASFMEQMTSTVENNANTAVQASNLAQQTSSSASQGGQAMHKVSDVMSEISTSANRMNDIIGTIDSIAFQTNILALNAAVEAARAGEQGRGFAVVASEVRSLAQRSATAAKEIKDLINNCVDKVQNGTALVNHTQTEIEAIVQQVQQVSSLITEISAATREQRDGILEASQSIGQMDAITQQNAALVEQSAAASQSLESQTQRLVEAVGVFH